MFINRFPKTNFVLSNLQVIESVNILKSIVISEAFKNNPSYIKSRYTENVKKTENLSASIYGIVDLYWLVLYLNDIDSFSKMPLNQPQFEIELKEKYPGTVYYLKDGKNVEDIKAGDVVVLFTGATTADEWKKAGAVKEYDSTFRRIILKTEYENSSNSASLDTNPDIYFFRKYTDDSFVEIENKDHEGNKFKLGRTETEVNKIDFLYDTGSKNNEISPFVILSGSTPTDQYDFSLTGPTSGTAIYKLSNNDLPTDIKSKTFFDVELEKNNETKTIKHINASIAGDFNAAVSKMMADKNAFERGTEIDVKIVRR
tara:strand:+ start:1195 stop:2136 length:942 start_codon:yes stop_codon:yes gene_type:complete